MDTPLKECLIKANKELYESMKDEVDGLEVYLNLKGYDIRYYDAFGSLHIIDNRVTVCKCSFYQKGVSIYFRLLDQAYYRSWLAAFDMISNKL